MSNSWPVVRLDEVLRRVKSEVRIDSETTYTRLTIRMNGRGIVLRDRLLGFEIGTKRQFVARSGQLVLSKIDARNGAFGILPTGCDNAIITGNFWAFDADTVRLEPRYFEFLTRTPMFLDFCIRASEGTTNRRYLQEDQFLQQEIQLPLLEEQERIVARVEELAAKIYESRLLQEQVLTESEALVVSTHIKLSGTRTRKLGQILRLDEDSIPIAPGQSYPQVGIKSFGAGLFGKAAVTGAETTYKGFNKLYEGAIVLSQVKGWEGAVAVCGPEFAGWFASPEYRTFRCDPDEARPSYLAALVKTEWFWSRLTQATRGAGDRRERTRPEQFVAIEISMPELEQQKRGEAVFAQLHAAKRLQTETAVELNALSPSILDRAFKGEL